LTVARYNVGGGNASDVPSYLRLGGAVPGYWAADPDGSIGTYGGVSTAYADRAALAKVWDPENPDHFDWTQDSGQRWWLSQLAVNDQLTALEAFANSSPYFLTVSGYTSGGTSSTAEQLPVSAMEQFAGYLVKVVEHLEDQYQIEFDTIEPFNEANTNYWSTTLSGGVPTGGRQEGQHIGPAYQAQMLTALAAALEGADTDAVISAMDETNPGTFITNWNGYSQEVRDLVGQMNVHTYGTGSRLQVRDLSKAADTSLYMSEVEGDWSGSGFNPPSMANALGLSGRITDDLRELESNAWVLWQPVEDLYNMDGTYPDSENRNWGSLYIDFDCQYYGAETAENFKSARRVAQNNGDPTGVEPCHILVNSKFNAMRNFTNFIHPGDSLIAVDNTSTTAALNAAGDALTLVYSNTSSAPQTITVNLDGFATISAGASATAYVSTEPSGSTLAEVKAAGVVKQEPVDVDSQLRNVTLELPARSVSTIVVDGVSGVSDLAAGPRDGQTYLLKGKASARYLADGGDPEATNEVQIEDLAADATGATAQAWTFYEANTDSWDQSEAKAFVIRNGSGLFLTATSAGTSLDSMELPAAQMDPNATWIVSTTNGYEFSLMNKALGQSLEVNGQATAAGSPVGVYGFSGGSHQYWTLSEIDPLSVESQVVATPLGIAPTLPTTATPVYQFGPGTPVAVTWQEPAATVWNTAGEVWVYGDAVDLWGTPVTAAVRVLVGPYSQVDPSRLKVAAGMTAAAVEALAPTSVAVKVGSLEGTVDAPVTWDFSGVDDMIFSAAGVLVPIPGSVVSNTTGNADLVTTLYIVTFAGGEPIANLCTSSPKHVSSVAATFQESNSYRASYVCDGSTSTRWSNWRSAGRTEDTLTFTLDGSYLINSVSVMPNERAPLTILVEVNPSASDNSSWVATSAGTVGELPLDVSSVISFEPIQASRVRLVMTFNSYGKISEVGISTTSVATSVAALADLRLDGISISGFDSGVLTYQATGTLGEHPEVTGIPAAEAATVNVVEADDPARIEVQVTAEDGVTTATYTVELITPEPPVEFSAVVLAVSTRCLASKVTLVVTATNAESQALDIDIASDYGGKTFLAVAPDKKASLALSTRLTTLPAGSLTLTVTDSGPSIPVSAERSIPFAGASC
jgi:hypothetical protein